ncbi:MAG TPA: hypothetical protein VF145_00870 [Chitinophagaceae bacterium]
MEKKKFLHPSSIHPPSILHRFTSGSGYEERRRKGGKREEGSRWTVWPGVLH